ncbi:MAG: thiol reductase thioredoxin [Burkholderiales bacterium RIFCSPLOWO2_02_FULL_57_36]|nr:MAG: thiol reductase thioredoxin [Burkholderiales bacterium RIFCSPLOWO2_02_FULL_57_36]
MSSLTLTLENRSRLAKTISDDAWIVVCLCAAWCDVCGQYRPGFDQLADRHPDKHFIWIDIEDQADVVGDLEVENFPTLLIQRADTVAFFGAVQPEPQQANRLLLAQVAKTGAELDAEAASSEERRTWQLECNLRARLQEALRA